MSGPVDVLAWLDSLHATTANGAIANGKWDEAQTARAVVAELIEAASEMNRLAKGPTGGVGVADKHAVIARMDAAIARVGGAS